MPNNRTIPICLAALLVAAGCITPREGQFLPDGSAPTNEGPEAGVTAGPDATVAGDTSGAPHDAAADGGADLPPLSPSADGPPTGPMDSAPLPDAQQRDLPPSLRATGQACNAGSECASGHCAEKVCCNSACGTSCSSCLAANTGATDGQCAPVKAGQDPYDHCTAAAATSCRNDGACNGSGGCRQWASGTPCRTASCMDGAGGSNATPAGTCNGSGSCQDQGTGGSCGRYLCGGNQCRESCSSASQCRTGSYCDGANHCVTCPQPSAANRLANAGFNLDLGSWTRTLDQWALDRGADILRSTVDRNGCVTSGSMEMRFGDQTNVIAHQCVASGEGSYAFGGAFLASKVSESVTPGGHPWSGTCGIRFYGSMIDCTTGNNQLGRKDINLHTIATEAGQWINFGASWSASLGTNAVMFECNMIDDGVGRVYVLLDQLYLRTSGSGF